MKISSYCCTGDAQTWMIKISFFLLFRVMLCWVVDKDTKKMREREKETDKDEIESSFKIFYVK